MIKKKLTALGLAGVLALASGIASAGDPLRVGVEGASPPFSWKEADGSLKGFDIDSVFCPSFENLLLL